MSRIVVVVASTLATVVALRGAPARQVNPALPP